MRTSFGPRRGALLLGLAVLGGCTRANPAYRIDVHEEDAGESPPLSSDAAPPSPDEAAPAPDAAVASDLPAPDVTAAPDLALGPDLAVSPDVTPPRDLAPDVSLPRDLAPDLGVSPNGLVAYWRFDELAGTTLVDTTGNGNTGTTKGGPTWTIPGFPKAKFNNPGALALDGQDDYVEVTVKTIPSNTANKTLSVWFRAVNPAGLPIRNLVALINDTADVGIQLGIDGGRVAAWYYGYPDPLVTSPAQVDGNWHHAAYTFDGKTHRIYYDGKLQMSVDSVPKMGAITHTRLGTYQAPDELFAGTIDDVRIYSRALADSEITALWSGE